MVECGKMLEKNGYVIKSLNTINFRKSMHYNPFAYIRSEKDILKLVNTIIVNTKGDGDKSGRISGSRQKSSTIPPSSAISGTKRQNTRKTSLPCSN